MTGGGNGLASRGEVASASPFNNSIDRRIAYALLRQIIADCASPRKVKYIREIRAWVNDDATTARYFPGPWGFLYTFTWWCVCLDVEEGWMRRKLEERLSEWEKG